MILHREPYSHRICIMDVRISLNPKREHPLTIKANEARSTSAKGEETRSGNAGHRVQGTPRSAVQKDDSNRKGMVTRLTQQFETHPNHDSLIEGLNKTEQFNPFSEVEGVITSMGNTEYFELWEISSDIQCPDCSLYFEVGIVHCSAPAANACSRRKGIDS